jgi:hypothetical protein
MYSTGYDSYNHMHDAQHALTCSKATFVSLFRQMVKQATSNIFHIST